MRDAPDRFHRGGFDRIEWGPFLRGIDDGLDLTAAPRIVTATQQLHVDATANVPQERQKHTGEVVNGRRPSDIRSTYDAKPDRPRSGGCDRESRLEHEGDAPGGPDVERVLTALNRPGSKRDLSRPEFEPVDRALAKGRHGPEGRDVLGR